ncbi:MAG: UvrB/UvrC motif-containing protein [Clostridia bacterium]|nr:UvrB/UvrC motif-containing protein [Clostridia bacterium]
MKCQNCGENEANVRYTQIINGKKEEIFVCDKCASQLKLDMNFKFGFDDVFSSFFGEPAFFKPLEISDGLVCDVCGTKYDDFASTGMLGCENCYRVFSRRLDNVLKKLHGNNRHIEEGERQVPMSSEISASKEKKKSLEEVIAELKEKLASCIKSEDYEQAAIIRDKIKKLEKKLNDKKFNTKKLEDRERGE